MSAPDRRGLLQRDHESLSIRRQCQLLSVARSSIYRPPRPANDNDVELIGHGFLYLVAIINWASRAVLPGACRTRWTHRSACLRSKRWYGPAKRDHMSSALTCAGVILISELACAGGLREVTGSGSGVCLRPFL